MIIDLEILQNNKLWINRCFFFKICNQCALPNRGGFTKNNITIVDFYLWRFFIFKITNVITIGIINTLINNIGRTKSYCALPFSN